MGKLFVCSEEEAACSPGDRWYLLSPPPSGVLNHPQVSGLLLQGNYLGTVPPSPGTEILVPEHYLAWLQCSFVLETK